MDIDRGKARDSQDTLRQQHAIGSHDKKIRFKAAKHCQLFFAFQAGRLADRNAVFFSQHLYRRRLKLLSPSGRPVRLRIDAGDGQ